MTVKEIRTLTGLSQKKFAELYGIPWRTVQNWEQHDPPVYLLRMLERIVREDFDL